MKNWQFVLIIIAVVYVIAMIVGAVMYSKSLNTKPKLTGNAWDEETQQDYNTAMGLS